MKNYKYSEITPEKVYNNRRKFIKSVGLGLGSLTLGSMSLLNNAHSLENNSELTSYKDITTYNNYYEFGTGKGDPYKNSQEFKVKPWNISIEGEVESPIIPFLLMKYFRYFLLKKEFINYGVLKDGQWLSLGWVFR